METGGRIHNITENAEGDLLYVQPTNTDLHEATWTNTAFRGLGCVYYEQRVRTVCPDRGIFPQACCPRLVFLVVLPITSDTVRTPYTCLNIEHNYPILIS